MDAGLAIASLVLNLAVLAVVILSLARAGGARLSREARHRLDALVEGQTRLEQAQTRLEQAQVRLEQVLRAELGQAREESGRAAKLAREELRALGDSLFQTLREWANDQRDWSSRFAKDTEAAFEASGARNARAMSDMAEQQRGLLDSFAKQLVELTRLNEQKLEQVRSTVEGKLAALQADNNEKLEQMRATVDEKLHATLEKRLGESFQLVSERLEQVHKGLGEMQSLASGVGDLKRVLTNVKTRGTLGEIQLGNLLEQVLHPQFYEQNAAVQAGSAERVDFVVKLPGKGEDDEPVLLPIDAKFPLEDYQRLVEAQLEGNAAVAADAAKALEARIRAEAKSIQEKYIHPPETTDFAILFLPVEGLFAEVLRRSGLWEALQRDYRVVVTGPTTLTALLNSLQMGFRTLAIQKRSSEVWKLLGAVKTEFGKFGQVLDKTQKKLQEASRTIEAAKTRSRVIEKNLRGVEALPSQGRLELDGALDLEPAEDVET
ncbi:MAG: DNA recombination protein RmuC [Alicyclobacillus sp.]|nr:DNA recombination protein RmuC [Alicyclobacillus sp.]